jgi:hypothetical protein
MPWAGQIRQEQEIFFPFSEMSCLALGSAQPPVEWVLRAHFTEVEWLRCDVDHSPPFSAKVQNEEDGNTSIPLPYFRGVDKDNRIFTFMQ